MNNSLSDKERKELELFLTKKKNRDLFKKMIKEHHFSFKQESNFELDNALKKTQIKLGLQQKKSFKMVYKYAAIFLLSLGVATFWYTTNKNSIHSNQNLANNAITITNGSGIEEIITTNYPSGFAKISLKNKVFLNENNNHDLVQTLKVPFGKRVQIELSDGTTVDLNSGSTLKYPVSFKKDSPRVVHLEGEGYFSVTHDPENKFLVHLDTYSIEVLGTEFNASSYSDDVISQTTLEKGSIRILTKNNSQKNMFLKPSESFIFHKKQNILEKNVVDTKPLTHWRTGELIFKNESFKTIAKKLTRKFNIQIEIKSTELENEHYTAHFNNESLTQILTYFSKISDFEFEEFDQKIIINN